MRTIINVMACAVLMLSLYKDWNAILFISAIVYLYSLSKMWATYKNSDDVSSILFLNLLTPGVFFWIYYTYKHGLNHLNIFVCAVAILVLYKMITVVIKEIIRNDKYNAKFENYMEDNDNENVQDNN